MISILVVEDEALVAKRLIRFIKASTDQPIQLHHVKTLEAAQNYLASYQIDLLFLDLNINGKEGFDLLKTVVHEKFHTIIASAYTDQAIKAFEFGVLDFVGKPFTQDRLNKAVERYFQVSTQGTGNSTHLGVKIKGDIIFVPLSEICFFKAAGIYSELHTKNDKVYVYDKPLNSLIKILPETYERMHKSFAVDIKLITAIEKVKHNTYEVKLSTGHSLPISRNLKKSLASKLSLE